MGRDRDAGSGTPGEDPADLLQRLVDARDWAGVETQIGPLARAAAGSDGSLERLLYLIDRCRLAYGAIWSVLSDPDAVDDAAQETIVAVTRGIHTFKGEARFTTWLYQVARNAAIATLKSQGRDEPLELVAEQPSGMTRSLSSMVTDRVALDRAIAELPPTFREALELRERDQLEYAEIAIRLGVPLGTARSRIAGGAGPAGGHAAGISRPARVAHASPTLLAVAVLGQGGAAPMRLPAAIGRYRTQGLLGTGSFATVLLAEDEALETRVAIKVLAENWSLDPDVRARFVREARILRRIDSERLIRVHDIGEFEQRPYFVMDFASGGTLAARLDALRADGRMPLPDDVVLALAGELAGCIGAAHSFGVIHRDVKPSNLLVRPARGSGTSPAPAAEVCLVGADEELVLADFGLARDVLAGSALSVGAGTHGYMAPEQAEPGGPVDERTDVYACTVILASALTGASPVEIADREQRARVLPGLDRSVAEMLERGLARDRDRRPASADEWLEESRPPCAANQLRAEHNPTTRITRSGFRGGSPGCAVRP